MSGFIDFAEVKARCSIEQAAKLLGLQCTEKRNQLRAPCPACGNGHHPVKRPRPITVEALGLSQETAETLGIGYAPKGMTKGYVDIPIRLPTGELTGHIGITEAKLPKEFHLSNVVTFPKKSA